MIFIFSHDLSLSDSIIARLPNQEGEFFSEENRLASALHDGEPAGILFDLRSGMRPLRLIERVFMERPQIAVVIIQPSIGLEEEIYFEKELYWPVDPDEIVGAFDKIRAKRKLLDRIGIIGRSNELAEAASVVDKVAASDVNVLITGPSGTGKEVIARAIHSNSEKPNSPFVAVNVAAMAPGIIESELFGHEKGAFTGAASRRIGVFEQAAGGVIFLDEIGEMPPEIQAKLLRVLEERSFTRVGGNNPIDADFRLVAATNRVLSEEIASAKFRDDLYYRLSVVSIELPSLASRKSDIAPLAFHFLKMRKAELKTESIAIEPGALRLFHRYEWPGNIRELKNVIYSFSITSPSGRVRAEDFEKYVLDRRPRSALLPVATGRTPETAEHQIMIQAIMTLTGEIRGLKHLIENELEKMRFSETGPFAQEDRFESVKVEEVEKELIIKALRETGGNRKKAARLLGLGERTLYRKLEKYGLK